MSRRRPNSSNRTGRQMPPRSEWTESDAAKLAAMETQMGGFDREIREVNSRVVGLERKVENSIAALAEKLETGLSVLANKISEKGSTNWLVIFTGIGVAVTVAGMIGYQALSPLDVRVNKLETNLVPRVEHDYRQSVENERFKLIEDWAKRLEAQRHNDLSAEIERLRRENSELKHPNSK